MPKTTLEEAAPGAQNEVRPPTGQRPRRPLSLKKVTVEMFTFCRVKALTIWRYLGVIDTAPLIVVMEGTALSAS